MTAPARWIALVFALALAWVGVHPLAFPDAGSGSSQSPAYAWFHLAGALVGLAVVGGRARWSGAFLLGFGVLDLYQAVASWAGWFPHDLFRWTPTDDALHWGLGAVLVVLGVWAPRWGKR